LVTAAGLTWLSRAASTRPRRSSSFGHCSPDAGGTLHVILGPDSYKQPAGLSTGGSVPYVQCAVLLCPPTITTITLSSTNKLLSLNIMSHTQPTATLSLSSPNFQLIIDNALDTYKKRTRNDLRAHPLAAQLQTCNSPTAILTVLQQQVQGSDQSRSTDELWTKWLDPTVNVLYAFSGVLGAGASLVCFSTSTCLRSALLYFVAAILTCERHLCRSRRPPFSVYP
jgi:hypothetical protein